MFLVCETYYTIGRYAKGACAAFRLTIERDENVWLLFCEELVNARDQPDADRADLSAMPNTYADASATSSGRARRKPCAKRHPM